MKENEMKNSVSTGQKGSKKQLLYPVIFSTIA